MKIFYFYFFFLCYNTINASPEPTEKYLNYFNLQKPNSPNGEVNLFWNYDKEKITFEIHSEKSKNWILFGIKSFSFPSFSDVIVAWLNDDNTGHFSDRYLQNDEKYLKNDEKQDWILIDAFFKENYSIFKFTRDIKLCNNDSRNSQDLDIPEEKVTIVFETGSIFLNNDIQFTTAKNINLEKLIDSRSGPYSCVPKKSIPLFTSIPTAVYTDYEDLVPGLFRFYWNISDTDLIGEIHCQTSGWVGFGLSPNGGMDKSDVIIGWISNNGVVNFTDRFINERTVKIDKNQNWNLLSSKESNGYTIFKFQRKLKLCDSEDRLIERGSPYVIFAWGIQDPVDGTDIGYHMSNRGSKPIDFYKSYGLKKGDASINSNGQVEIMSFTIENVILPRVDTFYYNQVFKVPMNMTQKKHMFKFELVLPTINFESMHHFIFYECNSEYDGVPFIPNGNMFGTDLYNKYCPSASFGWAVGGNLVHEYPPDQGYPIGGNDNYKYIVMSIHYDNPKLNIGYIERFAIKMYLSSYLRKNEIGVMTFGILPTPTSILLPPNAPNFKIKAFCSKSCIDEKLTNSLTIVSANPHTHLTGIEVSTKLIRNGKDIGYLYKNKYYDFNYQNSYYLNQSIEIFKGDEFITECVYNTKSRKNFTFGGEGTRNEMCQQSFTYYPRNKKFTFCFSIPAIEDLVDLFLDLNQTGDVKIEAYESVEKLLKESYLTLNHQSTNVKNKFEKFYDSTRFYPLCGLEKENKPEKQIISSNLYKEPDICAEPDKKNESFFMQLLKWLFPWLFN